MRDDKELFKSILVSTSKNIPWSKEQKSKEALFYILLAQVLLLSGAVAMDVLFRKNFRKNAVDILAFIVACLCFAGVAALSFYQSGRERDFAVEEHSPGLVRGIIYTVITLLVVWLGVSKLNKASDNNQFSKGESQLLGFLAKDGVTQNTIQLFFEPLVLIVLGTTYCFFDFWGGLPLIACGVSVWVRWVLHSLLLENPTQKSINATTEERSQSNSKKTRYTAK